MFFPLHLRSSALMTLIISYQLLYVLFLQYITSNVLTFKNTCHSHTCILFSGGIQTEQRQCFIIKAEYLKSMYFVVKRVLGAMSGKQLEQKHVC